MAAFLREAFGLLNGSRAVGARPVDVHGLGVDALVSCGFKWLCGPYATAFAWNGPDTVEQALARLDAAGVDVAERAGRIRIAPHVHNTPENIDRALAALAARPTGGRPRT
jgi:selenocysteine lyase/cysteine desulfurase